jgi:hypothetical protein
MFRKMSMAELHGAWLMPMKLNANDDAAIKQAVKERERLLKKSGVSSASLEEFGMHCLHAGREHVVAAMETCGLTDAAGELGAVSVSPYALLGETSRIYEIVSVQAERAASRYMASTSLASSAARQAERSVGVATELESLAGVTTEVAGSVRAASEAGLAEQEAAQLGGIALALRMLVWGSHGASTMSPYSASKASVCAVLAAANSCAVEAYAPQGGGHQTYLRLAAKTAEQEQRRQADELSPATFLPS